VRGVLTRPRATFEALAAAPRSADVLVLVFVAASAATALVLETDTGALALLDQLERTTSAFGARVDEARYAELQALSAHGTTYALATSMIGGPLVATGLSAALVWTLRGPAVRQVAYRQVLAMASHAGVILGLRQVVAAPLVYARETMASPLTLSLFLGLLDDASPLARFAGMIDLFVIWWVAVLAIGVSVLYQRSVLRVAAVFAGVYALLAGLIAVVMALVGGAA
jgi:hypothetical protein